MTSGCGSDKKLSTVVILEANFCLVLCFSLCAATVCRLKKNALKDGEEPIEVCHRFHMKFKGD